MRPATAMIVLAHPDPASFSHALAAALQDGFRSEGVDCTLHDLHSERFDPVMTADEARGRPTGDSLVARHIAALKASDILAVVHPNCWGAPPAMMKGWMDRVFAPGAAYAFEKGDDQGDAPVGLLRARSAIVINTSNTSAEREAQVFGDPLQRIWADCLLSYCGVGQIDRRVLRVVATSTPEMRQDWLAEAQEAAKDHVKQFSGTQRNSVLVPRHHRG